MQQLPTGDARWQLYRLLSDPTRLRLLALAAEEELSVGELSELLNEPQPNVSRQAGPLRHAGLLSDRKQGARTLIRLADGAEQDPVVLDALASGRRLCSADGSLGRVTSVVSRRDAKTREFFSRPGKAEVGLSLELPVYLAAFAPLIGCRELAVDAGTGDGALLDLLAPLFQRVVAMDRSEAQLARAEERLRARGYTNVELVLDQLGGGDIIAALGEGADLVVAARVLHHAPRPKAALSELSALAKPGGRVLVIDYARHDDEQLAEQQADVWMGFAENELHEYADAAGLCDVHINFLTPGFVRSGPDAHVPWLSMLGTRALHSRRQSSKTKTEERS